MLTKTGGLAGTLALAFISVAAAPSFAADAPAAPAAPAAAPASTVQAPPPTLIVLDFDRILQESKVGKSVIEQLQQRAATFQKSFQQQEADLNTDQQGLVRQQSILAQDAFSAKARDLQRRADELREKEAQANAALQQSNRDAILRIQQSLKPILEDIMKERGANVVINRGAIALLSEDRFEVTDEAMKRLDEKMPTLTISVAEPQAAAAPPATAAPAAAAAKPAPASKKKP
jgi:outer membrane protein